MAQSTLLGWANSVRMTMTNDPGRELFQEQVQTYGFSFLDNYLNDILSGAKQEYVATWSPLTCCISNWIVLS
jgi:hypothetical protein